MARLRKFSKVKNKVLKEIIDEIREEKEMRLSFPYWGNWGNWMNWMNWWT
jgi:hypothetical protein